MPDVTLPPTLPDAAPPPSYPELPPEPTGSWLARNRKSVILGVIAVLLVAAVSVTAWLQRSSPGTGSQANTAATNQTVPGSSVSGTNQSASTNRPTFRRYEATVTADKDNDGLTDEEEYAAGTRSDTADTDGDGLSDYDELRIYETNPTKPDTDGDSQTDGREVAAGKNPNGSGALLNLPQAIQQINNTNQ